MRAAARFLSSVSGSRAREADCVDFLRCSDEDEVRKESASGGAGESKSSTAGTSARTSTSEKAGRQEGKGGGHANEHDERPVSPL
jgi:hypothetical protein